MFFISIDRSLILILFMNQSVYSQASNASSKMLEEIANRSQTKIYRVEGTFNDEEMRIIWNALGLYISRNLRMGRGVHIPKFGLFTFTPPEVRLKGVTNQIERDQKPRMPIFLIQKQFIKGVNLKTAIFFHQEFGKGLRPYSALGSIGDVPITKMNLIQIASYANQSKDATQLGLTRIFKYISEQILAGGNVSLELPNVGQFICRNNLVAVKFNEYLNRDTRNILSKSVDERKLKGDMSLTTDNLKKFSNFSVMSQRLANKTTDFLEIDDNAKKFLQDSFDLHFDDSNYKRSTTNFDRTVASKMFDKTNQSLKNSQTFRMTQSGLWGKRTSSFNKEYNMSLKILKEWINSKGYNAQTSFKQVANLAEKSSQVLNQNDLWNACKKISIDITEQGAQELFRILDNNKDGFITFDDWKQTIRFQTNNPILKKLLKFLHSKKYSMSKVCNILGLEGVKRINIFSLKNGFLKLFNELSDDQALQLSKYISQGQNEVQAQKIIDALNLNEPEANGVEVDIEWQNKFFARLKRKMAENNIFEESLQSKFRFYDKSGSGYIEQNDFKTVLAEIGIGLTLTQLIKIVKFVPLNSKNALDYGYIVHRVSEIDQDQQRQELTANNFKKIIQKQMLSQSKLPFSVPISVNKLTSLLQASYFKQYSQQQLLPFVQQIDINQNNEVSEEDINGYREKIKQNKVSPMDKCDIDDLLVKLREKSIKKKISYFDLFRKIDKAGKGFITKEQWIKNLDEIISFSTNQKENLFAFMDKGKIQMVDYKTFLSIMNGNTNLVQSQKFDWVEEALDRIKKWYKESKLTLEDAFRIIDKDGDTYINQKDLQNFLIEKIKYQERELSLVRLQKLMKVLDFYKRGQITFLDWHKINNSNKNWLIDAKQQIGIVLSRMYSSLSEAFVTITQGDKKLLFSAFQKWIKANHVLSGFMANDDILKFIFSDLDQHKKGYLLQNDFVGLFGSYDWKAEQTNEFIDSLKIKFKSAQEAFRCMTEYNNGRKSVDYNRFKAFISELFGNRFKEGDCLNIWKNIVGNRSEFTFQEFNNLYGNNWADTTNPINIDFPKDDWKYQDFTIIKGTQIRTPEHEYEEKEAMQSQCNKFINNVKDILYTSPKTLEQAFLEVDTHKNGKITNLMFKKAFRILNIALTSKEIDLLLNYCNFKLQTLIDWRQFLKIFNIKEDKQKIVSRLSPKIQHLSDLLHYYMISPKDAYRKWNNPRSGYMNFEEFHKMLKSLFEQAGEPLPEYQQLKEYFQYIDIRKDSQLDFQEFTQVFRNCNPPNLLMGTTPASSDQIISKVAADKEKGMPIRQKSIPLFRHSPQYEKFINLIGRNRRYLQQEIAKANQNNESLIDFSVVKKVIRQFANKHNSKVNDEMIRNLIAFAMTGQKVDYQLLVSKFKDLNEEVVQFPKKKVY